MRAAKILGASAAATAALALATAGHAGKTAYVYGPAPEWEAYKALGTPAVLAKMPDPQHWSVEWPNGYFAHKWWHKGDFYGYLSCGVLQATGPVQDKRQRIQFVIVVDHGVVQTVDISQRVTNSLVNLACGSFIERGLLPPAPALAVSLEHSIATLGMTIREMPEGAYSTVVGDGAAKRAGLAPGMVVTAINDVPLAGMDGAMAKVLAAASTSATLTLADGRTISLTGSK